MPPWSLRLEFPDGSAVEAEDRDLFAALEVVRRRLEPDGLLVCCQGARPDVYPSGLARQMGAGRRSYRLRADRRPTREDLVDIFDPAGCEDVVTVEEQLKATRTLWSLPR